LGSRPGCGSRHWPGLPEMLEPRCSIFDRLHLFSLIRVASTVDAPLFPL
jgi:hypothetical protein